MRATSLLLGCMLSLGAIANAAATGTTAGSSMSGAASYNCDNHADTSHAASHDSASVSGDALSIPRSSTAAGSSSSNHTSTTSGDEATSHIGGGGDASSGSASHSAGLGWQSLLPGSIQ